VLNLTKRVDYGLIALTHLAALRLPANGSEPAAPDARPSVRPSVRELAETYQMSQPLLANVMKDLARLGFVRSVRGTKGGYELAVAPEGLSVGRVVEALEGPLRLTECAGHAEAAEPTPQEHLSCSIAGSCLIKRSVWIIHAKIRDALYGVTIADLARQAGPIVRSTARQSERLPLAPVATTTSHDSSGETKSLPLGDNDR
jgi:Rrf2 family protein